MSLPRPAKVAIAIVLVSACAASLYLYDHDEGRSPEQTTTDAYIVTDSTFVAPKVAGNISDVLVEDNAIVQKGQLLAVIDDRDFAVALDSAKADVVNAQADVARLEASTIQQQSLIQQASAAIVGDVASVNFAAANSRRYLNLAKDGSGTIQEQQQAESALQIANARQSQDIAARDAAQHQLNVLLAQTKQAAASVAKAEAALHAAELNLSYTRIVAPIDGTVGQRTVRTGAYVHVGTPLLAVVPLQEAYVEANFRETQLQHVKPGQAVTIRIDMLSGTIIHGHVNSLAPASGIAFSPIAPDNATGNFTKVVQRLPVKITIDPDQPAASRLRVGISVVPTVHTDTARSAPT
ncbi:secretion protein (plasmid) [Paraburkholderia terrae]|uniref:Secretion protein n=1 Tax=Paraburkholderia terrae TaxID=311230 RepID=A0ABM7U355_9BURK|nr:HlyD family secretion protein [Paraburkholderia terrae]BCZ85421.1 secretion protein [Paraburkholderia terrae]